MPNQTKPGSERLMNNASSANANLAKPSALQRAALRVYKITTALVVGSLSLLLCLWIGLIVGIELGWIAFYKFSRHSCGFRTQAGPLGSRSYAGKAAARKVRLNG